MNQVSLEFIVQGLSEFVSDVGKANSALDSLKPQSTILGNLFEGLGNIFGNVGNIFKNVADDIMEIGRIAFGVILRDAIRATIDFFNELTTSIINAGAEFQMFQQRLMGFNLQDAINSGMDYTAAMKLATVATQDQLNWIMKLAATTPFDATDIANIFSLAKSYGFATPEVKRLTENIMNFTAAMGLTGTEAQRIIVNLGQMVQRGKITTREMNDLARGAFVPLSDILDRIALKLGITTAELTKMISKPGGGVDPQLFIEAFNEMAESEERFADGAYRMAHTFKGATENIWQSIRDIIGGFIILPGILAPLGKYLGDIMDEVAKRWTEISGIAEDIGNILGSIVTAIIGETMPKSETIVDWVIGKMEALKQWLNVNKQPIIDAFVNIRDTIFGTPAEYKEVFGESSVQRYGEQEGGPAGIVRQKVQTKARGRGWIDILHDAYDWIVTKLWPALQTTVGYITNLFPSFSTNTISTWAENIRIALNTITTWYDENKGTIEKFTETIGTIFSKVVENLFGTKPTGKTGLETVLDSITKFMQYVIDNEEGFTTFLTNLARAFILFSEIQFILSLVVGSIIGLISFFLNPINAIAAFGAVPPLIYTLIFGEKENENGAALGPILLGKLQNFVSGIFGAIRGFVEQTNWTEIGALILLLLFPIPTIAFAVGILISNFLDQLGIGIDKNNKLWNSLGGKIMLSIIEGVKKAGDILIAVITNLFIGAINAGIALMNSVFKTNLPTLELVPVPSMEDIFGSPEKFTPIGPGTPVASVGSPTTGASAPVSSVTSSVVNNFNLVVNTAAKTEDIMADYAILRSMAG